MNDAENTTAGAPSRVQKSTVSRRKLIASAGAIVTVGSILPVAASALSVPLQVSATTLEQIADAVIRATGAKTIKDLEDANETFARVIGDALRPICGNYSIHQVKSLLDAIHENTSDATDHCLRSEALMAGGLLIEPFIANGEPATIHDAIARAEWGNRESAEVGDTGDDPALFDRLADDLKLCRDLGSAFYRDDPLTTFAGWLDANNS